nr:hypothetical protein [Tanacetum cinerariifolium]
MADMNIPANDAPAEQAPVITPPTRMDDQILPSSNWVPIGKSNCILDVQKSQRNLIFPISMAILKNTNFCRAFTSSSMIPAIYIQQFWDTMCFNSSTGLYSCQLDEQWFNLHKDILIDALDITLTNDNNPFVAPPSSDTVIEYINMLGYPSTLRNVLAMLVNAVYQSWRAILSMINMCLTGKTAGYDRPRHLVLQILWGTIHSSNINYAERFWEEFVQSIQTFLTDRKNLATASRGKKNTTHLLIPSVREIFGMPILDALLTDEIKGATYYDVYQEHVAKYHQYLDAIHDKAEEGEATESSKATKVTKPKAANVTKPASDPKPKPAPTEPSKAVPKKKQKLVQETSHKISKGGLVIKICKLIRSLKLVDKPSAEDVPVEELAYNKEEANLQRALELSLKEQAERTQGPARPVVIRKSDSGRIQPLPNVQGKGKEKWRTPMPTEASGHAESPSLDVELALTDSEIESDDGVPKINTGDQDKGHAGPNLESQPQSSHVVHAGPNLENLDLEATDALPIQKPKQLDEEFTTAAYPNVYETLSYHLKICFTDQFFVEKQQEEEPGKTNVEAEVSKAVDEIVTDAVDWVMQAPLRARFSDLPAVDMKEILQQWMFEDKSYEAHEDHKKLYDAPVKKRRDVSRTPFGSPPPQPPPPPPPAGASGAPGTSGALGSSQLPQPSLPLPSTGTSGSAQQQGSKVPSERKPRKGQNRIKTKQKREACQSWKSFKQLQLKEEEKPKKTKKEWPKMHTRIKSYSSLKKRRKEKGHMCNLKKDTRKGPILPTV